MGRLPILGDVKRFGGSGRKVGREFNSEFATLALNNIRRNEICRGQTFLSDVTRLSYFSPLFLSLNIGSTIVSTELQRSRLSDQLTCKKREKWEQNFAATSKGSFLILFIRKRDIKSTMEQWWHGGKKKKIEFYYIVLQIRKKKLVINIFKWNACSRVKVWCYFDIISSFFF